MPIYEFYCGACHCVFSFLSRTVNTDKHPGCPRCGRPELPRRVSLFAISKGRSAPATPAEGPPDMDEGRIASAMESLAHEAEGVNEDDPRQAARLMRRLYETAGMPVGSGMEEALKRMEAGEDPEKLEQELGDVFDEDPLSAGDGGEAREPKKSLASRLRRAAPPDVDPNLYEL